MGPDVSFEEARRWYVKAVNHIEYEVAQESRRPAGFSYERLTLQAVHASLAGIGEWDWIDWNGIGGPLAAALAAELTPLWYEVREDFVLDLPASWEELRAGLRVGDGARGQPLAHLLTYIAHDARMLTKKMQGAAVPEQSPRTSRYCRPMSFSIRGSCAKGLMGISANS